MACENLSNYYPIVMTFSWYYFHVNGSIGILQKIDFEIRPDLGCTTPKTARKVVLDNPSVCLSVCLCGCLAVCPSSCRFSREISQA